MLDMDNHISSLLGRRDESKLVPKNPKKVLALGLGESVKREREREWESWLSDKNEIDKTQ